MNDKQHRNNYQNIFKQVIDMPIPLYIFLATCSFLMLSVIFWLDVTRDGSFKLAAEHWILVGIFAFIVEVANQFTYYYSKRNRKAAKGLKAIIFWGTFSTCAGLYGVMLYRLPVVTAFNWSTQFGLLIISLLASLILPFYSFSPDIRFLLLYGTYDKKVSIS